MTDTAGEQWPPHAEMYEKIRRLTAWWSSDQADLVREFAVKAIRSKRTGGLVSRLFGRFWANEDTMTLQANGKVQSRSLLT
ncbi:hypothetical protein JOE61_000910 [Nocardioides salarius]|uniref:Uncharacterized protein n=1 Tax=Nocardioides salarius TaxID=374513 RepID=A0ABS2M7D2_9ACTN|nr:hypothetical protein [Nocardioides salarius]MBM7507096.1 hypothetical protein [Nocardioides salarius]